MLLGERLVEMELLAHHKQAHSPFTDNEEMFSFEPFESEDCLNTFKTWITQARSPMEVVSDLLQGACSLYLRACSLTGTVISSHVSLLAVSMSPDYKLFSIATEELQKVDLDKLSPYELLTFFINLFNLLAMHSHLHYVRAKSKQFNKFLPNLFSKLSYKVGGHLYTLNDLYFTLFRPDQKFPNLSRHEKQMFGLKSKQKENKLPFDVPFDERVAFALCFGLSDSPNIKIFRADTLDSQLNECVSEYLARSVIVHVDKSSVKVPSLLNWISVDFEEQDLRTLLEKLLSKYQIKSVLSELESLNPTAKQVVEVTEFDFSFYYDLNSVHNETQI